MDTVRRSLSSLRVAIFSSPFMGNRFCQRKLILIFGFFMISFTYVIVRRRAIGQGYMINGGYVPTGEPSLHQDLIENRPVDIPNSASNFEILSLKARNRYKDVQGETKKRRLPQCIIAGVRKGGTRALIDFLDLHPDIVTAEEEQHFFSTSKYKLGLRYYKHYMPYSYEGQVTMEKTPDYFPSPLAPHRIKRMNESIKLIFIVKEPVFRAVSEYIQFDLKKGRTEPFEHYATTSTGEVNTKYSRLMLSKYYKFANRWLSVFPRNQIHFANGDTLVTDPATELNKIETFLGIPHFISRDNFYFSEAKGFFCWVDFHGKESCIARGKGQKHPDVNPNVTQLLTDYYKRYNKKFFDLVGEDFGWPT